MKIKGNKQFKKQFKRLPKKLQEKVKSAILLFEQDPFNPRLRNHALHGRMAGKRAIVVTGDVRIIFQEFDDYTLVIFLDVGGHGQVYK